MFVFYSFWIRSSQIFVYLVRTKTWFCGKCAGSFWSYADVLILVHMIENSWLWCCYCWGCMVSTGCAHEIYCVWFLCISSFQATGFSLYLVWVLVVTVFVFSYLGWKSAIWTYKYPHGDTLEVLVWCEWEYVHPFHGSDLRMGMFNSLEIEIGRIKGCNGL